MRGNGLLVTVGVVLIAAVMWFLKSAHDVKKDLVPIVQQVGIAATPTPSLYITPTPSTNRSVEVVDTSTEVQGLQAQLAQEQQALKTKQDELARLQSQQAANQARGPASAQALYSTQMSQRQSEIENLNQQLNDARAREQQIDQATQQSMMSLNSSAQQTRLQLEDNIRVREGNLQQIQGEITFWQLNTQYLDQQARLADAQARYETERSQLENLQAQRAQLPNEVLQQNDNIQLLSAQAKQDVVNDQSTLQDQISTLYGEIQRLQSSQGESQMSRWSLGAQIWQTQQEINDQNARIQALQKDLETAQRPTSTTE